MKLVFSGCSRTGLVRGRNEDAMLMRAGERGALFLVADGIGGRAHGEAVSGMLRDGYDQWWEERFLPASGGMSFVSAVEDIKRDLFQLNRAVIDRFGEASAGSTLALLFLFQGNCLYLSAGDSRIYLARRFSMKQVTVDDVAVDAGASDGKLLGAFGISAVPAFSIRTDVLCSRDRFFLCSDGVYRYLSSQRLGRRMLWGRPDPERVIEEFSQEVERSGARDNYTMIYVRVESN